VVNAGLTPRSEPAFITDERTFNLSAATGRGFEALLAALAGFAEAFMTGAESSLVTRTRHRRALEDCLAALERSLSLHDREDLIAEELRLAARALGRLTGRVDVEDVLDAIFRDFCIGK
jgi:tRNA modification GTPase